MKLRQIILSLLFVAVCGSVEAKPVEPSVARQVASRFLPQGELTVTPLGDALYLVRPVSGDGFVLVAADDCVAPVLGFSPDGSFPMEEVPAHVQAWVDGYSADIAARRAMGVEPTDEVQRLWIADSPKGGLETAVAPMLTTTWSQSPRYNNMCPTDASGHHAVTGCVATAMAQVMKYWEHPIRGRGAHQYFSDFGLLYADYDTVYPWSSMPNSLGWNSTNDQINAVALLMYHVGVAVEMNYGVGSSGAQVLEEYGPSSEWALKTFFRYNPELVGIRKASYVAKDWDSIMLSEMHHGRPVLYTGFGADAGHAFVIDGCAVNSNASTGLRYFHVNWGWGGSYDGYFTLDALNPGGGGTGSSSSHSYNGSCQAVIGIRPFRNSLGDSVALVNVCSTDDATGTVSGNGVYTVGRDSIYVYATPAHGYRFHSWTSGSVANPIIMLADGDIVDTAIFVPIGRDTIDYAGDNFVGALSAATSDTTRWGIRIPADLRAPQRSITEVQFYVYGSGYYNLFIYQGDVLCPATLLYSHRGFYFGFRWITITLDSAVVVDNSRPLWVTFMNDGLEHVYPAATSNYCGNPDGSWFYESGRWSSCETSHRWYTWMIRAIFAERDSLYNTVSITTAYKGDTLGLPLPEQYAVTGAGTYPEGTTVTVTAAAGSGDTLFRYWETPWGSRIKGRTYTFVADYDLSLKAVYGPYLGIGSVGETLYDVDIVGRTVSVEAPHGTDIAAYDLQGRRVGEGRRFSLPGAGVYILRVDGTAKKLIVF